MSNKYWGWGLEDDEFYVRMRRADIMVERPVGIRHSPILGQICVHNFKLKLFSVNGMAIILESSFSYGSSELVFKCLWKL